jgi:hypothetical protein
VLEDRSAPPVAGHELGRVATVLATGLDIDALRTALPSPIERAQALRFGTHVAWADDQMDPGESDSSSSWP